MKLLNFNDFEKKYAHSCVNYAFELGSRSTMRSDRSDLFDLIYLNQIDLAKYSESKK